MAKANWRIKIIPIDDPNHDGWWVWNRTDREPHCGDAFFLREGDRSREFTIVAIRNRA